MKNNYHIRCKINGNVFVGLIDPNLRLLDFIRNVVGLTGTKEGCGEGECGACMVLLNGKAVNSCMIMAFQADGKEIITIEGIDRVKYGKILKDKFKDEGAVQCGFCTPGFIITAVELLNKNPKATVEEIKEYMVGNLCRCTGYKKIITAIDKARK